MKNYINKILIVGAVAVSIQANAQQNFQLSQYINSSNLLNPALTGLEDQTELTAGYRNQYSGWSGAGESPTTIYVTGSTSLSQAEGIPSTSLGMRSGSENQMEAITDDGKKNANIKHGVGGYAYTDKYGHFSRTSFGGSYAAHVPVSETMNLSIGGMLGLTSLGVNASDLTVVDNVNDDTYNALITNNENRMSVDFNIGIMLYSNQFFVGYSGYQFLGNKVFDDKSNLEGKLVFQSNIIAGYNYELNEDLNLIPTVLVKMVGGVKPTYDLGVKALYQKKFWAGLALRNEDAFVLFLGAQINDMISVGYSYDMNTSEINNYSSGGHEITVGVSLAKKGAEVKNNYLW